MGVLKSTLAALAVLLIINAVSLYASWQAFIKPLERAAHHLKNNRQVDLTEIASVKMYAKFTFRILASIGISVACVAYMATQVASGIYAGGIQAVIYMGGILWAIE